MNKYILLIITFFITISCSAIEITLNAVGNVNIFAGNADSIVDNNTCNVDLRGTSEDRIIDNYSSECIEFNLYTDTSANISAEIGNGTFDFVGEINNLELKPGNTTVNISGKINTLNIDSGNSDVTFEGTVLNTAIVKLGNNNLRMTITTPSLFIDKSNGYTTLLNSSIGSVNFDLKNSSTNINNSTLTAGKITAANSPLIFQNVLSNVNFKLINSSIKGNKIKVFENSSKLFNGVNSDVKLATVRCLPNNGSLNSSTYITKISPKLSRRVNRVNGKVNLLKQVTVNRRNKNVQCSTLNFSLINGIAKVS